MLACTGADSNSDNGKDIQRIWVPLRKPKIVFMFDVKETL
jgi:hypothetical protein